MSGSERACHLSGITVYNGIDPLAFDVFRRFDRSFVSSSIWRGGGARSPVRQDVYPRSPRAANSFGSAVDAVVREVPKRCC
jgi:hypothetical protein